jgi:hypothetical protein
MYGAWKIGSLPGILHVTRMSVTGNCCSFISIVEFLSMDVPNPDALITSILASMHRVIMA